MNLGRRFCDVVHTQLLASILDDDKEKCAVICLYVIFLDPVNQLPPPSHRPEFDPASFRKGGNGKYIKKRKMSKTISGKKDGCRSARGERLPSIYLFSGPAK
jgi:hypothetical protein